MIKLIERYSVRELDADGVFRENEKLLVEDNGGDSRKRVNIGLPAGFNSENYRVSEIIGKDRDCFSECVLDLPGDDGQRYQVGLEPLVALEDDDDFDELYRLPDSEFSGDYALGTYFGFEPVGVYFREVR